MTETPILNALVHPPLGVLQREIISGVFSGSGELTRPGGPFNVNAYGLTWDTFTVPAGWGRTLGQPDIYEPELVQLATTHVGLDSHEIISEYHAFFAEGIYWLWENPLPNRVLYTISPGIVLVFFWLVL